jgi:hypothetical protein
VLSLDSRDEAALQLLIQDPERAVEASAGVRAAARRIRGFFVRERGWTRGDLIRYRFRDLDALTREGEVRLCRTAGHLAWAGRQDDQMLRLTLGQLRAETGQARAKTLNTLTGGEMATVLEERRLALSAADWARITGGPSPKRWERDRDHSVSGNFLDFFHPDPPRSRGGSLPQKSKVTRFPVFLAKASFFENVTGQRGGRWPQVCPSAALLPALCPCGGTGWTNGRLPRLPYDRLEGPAPAVVPRRCLRWSPADVCGAQETPGLTGSWRSAAAPVPAPLAALFGPMAMP